MGWRHDERGDFSRCPISHSHMDFGIRELFVVLRSCPPRGCSEVSDEFFLMFLMKDDICLPSQKILPRQECCRTCCIHNMTQSLRITERLITGGKLHQKTYFLMMRMTAWCPVTWPDWADSLGNIVLALCVNKPQQRKEALGSYKQLTEKSR